MGEMIQVLTNNEQKAILDHFNRRTKTGRRNQLMIRLALETGMRCAEVLSLRWEDIYLDDEGDLIVHVRKGKRNKDRLLAISRSLFNELIELGAMFDREQAGEIFVTTKGTPVTAAYIRQLMLRVGPEVVGRRVNFHLLRHTLLTKVTRERGVAVAQKVAGHASIGMTMRYTHLDTSDVKAALVGFKPATGRELPGQLRFDGSVAK